MSKFPDGLPSAPWLTRTLQWFHTYCGVDYIGDLEQDVDDAVERIQALYLAAQAGVQERHKVRYMSLRLISVDINYSISDIRRCWPPMYTGHLHLQNQPTEQASLTWQRHLLSTESLLTLCQRVISPSL